MSDLDTKLALIVEDIIEYSADDGPLKAGQLTFAEQIKQAFADAGYLRVVNLDAYEAEKKASYEKVKQEWQGPDSVRSVGIDEIQTTEVEYDPAPEERYGPMLMNGQYWYSRFDKELSSWSDGAYSNDIKTVLAAAKKAAGLSE